MSTPTSAKVLKEPRKAFHVEGCEPQVGHTKIASVNGRISLLENLENVNCQGAKPARLLSGLSLSRKALLSTSIFPCILWWIGE